MNQAQRMQPTPGSAAQIPAVVGHYVTYLRAKTHVIPEITVSGNRANVRVSCDEGELILVFGCHGKQDWWLHRAEVRRGAQTASFTCGQLVQAMAALLGHEPSNPEGQQCLLTIT